MKKALAFALCIVCTMVPVLCLAEVMYVATQSGSGVHLREGPDVDYESLETVPYGDAVEVLEMLLGSSWIHVNHNGNFGYIMVRYLSYDPPGPVPTRSPSPTARPQPSPNRKLSANAEPDVCRVYHH